MASLDPILRKDEAYPINILAAKLGYRDTRQLRKALDELGVFATPIGRNEVVPGSILIAALEINSQGPDCRK